MTPAPTTIATPLRPVPDDDGIGHVRAELRALLTAIRRLLRPALRAVERGGDDAARLELAAVRLVLAERVTDLSQLADLYGTSVNATLRDRAAAGLDDAVAARLDARAAWHDEIAALVHRTLHEAVVEARTELRASDLVSSAHRERHRIEHAFTDAMLATLTHDELLELAKGPR